MKEFSYLRCPYCEGWIGHSEEIIPLPQNQAFPPNGVSPVAAVLNLEIPPETQQRPDDEQAPSNQSQ